MPDKFVFQDYLIVFVDQLGQREKLRKITGIPTTEEGKQKFIEDTRESIGRVLHMREAFKNFFDAAASKEPNFNLVPAEFRDEFITSLKRPELVFYGLSDAVVIGVPLKKENEHCSGLNGVYDAFVATSGIGLLSLSMGVPMRAGLNVGVATKIDDKELYGPALESAFYLESKLAEYPRFLIGKDLVSYLLWVENLNSENRLGIVAKGMAKFCGEMIFKDSDGRFMLDFLGPKIKEATDGVINQDLVCKAFEFVISQYKKLSDEGNEDLASRYYRLLRYFNSRKTLWGIS